MKNTENLFYYTGANPTVDLVIINPNQEILLIKRSSTSPACADMWALPGGFIDTTSKKNESWKPTYETSEQAALRELKEETNLSLTNPKLYSLGIYEGNNRDPRDNEIAWSKSHAFLHIISKLDYESQIDSIIGLDKNETSDVKWTSIEEIKNVNLAFDHNQIVKKGIQLSKVIDTNQSLHEKMKNLYTISAKLVSI